MSFDVIAPPVPRRRARVALSVVATGLVLTALAISPLAARLRSKDADSSVEGAIAACGAAAPAPALAFGFQQAPPMSLDAGLDYRAVFTTSCGDFVVDLLEDKAPIAVNNFVFLAQQGFYDGLVFHQVKHDFVIQTGDPDGENGLPDGPGYAIPDELPTSSDAYTFGTLAMARRSRPDSGGSQFFIVAHDFQGAVEGNARSIGLAPDYTVFGRVEPGYFGWVERIARQQTRGGSDPILAAVPRVPIYVEQIEITAEPK